MQFHMTFFQILVHSIQHFQMHRDGLQAFVNRQELILTGVLAVQTR